MQTVHRALAWALVAGLVLGGLGLGAWATPMPGSVPVHMQTLQRQAKGKAGGRYRLVAKVPVVSGLAPVVATAINKRLAAACPWTPESFQSVDSMEKGETYQEDVEGQVTLNGAGLLSVHYQGLGVNTLNGHMNSAHPTKLVRSLTLRLLDGRVVRLPDLFRKGAPWQAFLSKRVYREFNGGKDTAPPADAPRIGDGEFYLARRELVIIFPEAAFAVQGAEVKVPYADLVSLADSQGPLAPFLPARH